MDIKGNWFTGNLSILKEKVNGVKPSTYISNAVGCPFAYEVRPETVGEYTGLFDKNGKEIYEGDIVENAEGKAVVKFETVIQDMTESGFGTGFFADSLDLTDCEIIGNIYETKKCKNCGYNYQDPKYCSVWGRTADEHEWI